MDTGLTYLAVAYGGFFLALAGFLYRIVSRDGQLQAAVDALEARVASGERN